MQPLERVFRSFYLFGTYFWNIVQKTLKVRKWWTWMWDWGLKKQFLLEVDETPLFHVNFVLRIVGSETRRTSNRGCRMTTLFDSWRTAVCPRRKISFERTINDWWQILIPRDQVIFTDKVGWGIGRNDGKRRGDIARSWRLLCPASEAFLLLSSTKEMGFIPSPPNPRL